MKVSPVYLKKILRAQKSEITEHIIYKSLSRTLRNAHNREILARISEDELRHYEFLKFYTGKSLRPHPLKIGLYFLISKFFGLTFGIKLMERGEQSALKVYREISAILPQTKSVIGDESKHEHELVGMIDEERLKYTGAVVRGLNEALVELTGTLTGLTLAFQKTGFIATVGLVIGAAMCFSLGSSEYLATKTEESNLHPLKAAAYTGLANILTVSFLIFPYLIFPNIFVALTVMLINALIAIYIFNFYISVAKNLSLKMRFLEMALISLGIGALTFGIGYVARTVFHVEI